MANEITKPEEATSVRDTRGRFVPGHSAPGPGRPAQFEAEKERFACQCRYEIRRRKLAPERMAAMAAGEGEYAKLPVAVQHAITMDLLSYAYGKPTVLNIVTNNETNVTLVKRVIGVNGDDV
jgi:hypothetical protein